MLHPRFATLSAFADGALPPARRPRVAAHVAECARCRGALADIRAMASTAASLPDPPLPADGLQRILARRAAGERLILAVESAPPARRPARPMVRAAAAVALLATAAGGLVLATAPRLEAVSSELRLAPEAPRAGQAVRLAYTPGTGFAGARALVVRARLRHPGERAYREEAVVAVLDTLRPDGDGVFRGEARLPAGAVYAELAVEAPDGTEVDTNGRRYWEVLVHDAAGRPLADALHQRAQALTGRDWEGAFDAARRMAELYPEDPESWGSLQFFENALRGAAAGDSLAPIHRARFAALDSALRGRPGLDGEALGAMYFYAWGVGDSIARERWDERLRTEQPRHPKAVQNRTITIMRAHYEQPAEVVRQLDALWDEVGPAHSQLALQGILAARRTRDPESIRRWVPRYLRFYRDDVVSVAEGSLAVHPSLRPDALRLLRAELARLRAPENAERFGVTRAEDRRRRDEQAAHVLAALGRHLLADGRTAAALDTLALATEVPGVWDAEVFLLAGRTRLQAGDTAGAARLLARVAVDPGTPPARRDSVAALARGMEGAAWSALLDDARREMRERVLARSVNRPVSGSARMVAGDGRTVPLGEAAGDAGTVVVFWSRRCGPAIDAVQAINRLAATLRADGVRVIAITDEPRSAGFDAEVRGLGLAVPMYHDTRREAARAFRAAGTPQYFVMDADGRVRYEYTSVDDIPRQLAVLR